MPRIIDWKQTIRNGATDLNVAEKVVEGITQLFEEDASMLMRRANERTITALLACHLRPFFAGWNVDCEFNRDFKDGTDIKKILGRRVVPDIIVHHRSVANVNALPNPADHLLVLEVKQSAKDAPDSAADAKDILKLARLRQFHGYQNALFVKFVTGDPMLGLWKIEWVTA